MSNYTKLVDYAAKDALPSGSAGKIVSGTEINTEFAAIETAVNTKADKASPYDLHGDCYRRPDVSMSLGYG
jgi:hypothetical protein